MSFLSNVMPKRFGAGASKGAMMETTFCPDCELEIPAGNFVAHREQEHPPAPKTIAVAGIKSKGAFGYDPPDPED